MAYRVFTVEGNEVKNGGEVQKHRIKGADMDIPIIRVGSQQQKLGIMPVELGISDRAELNTQHRLTIYRANLTETKAGWPKLVATMDDAVADAAVIIFLTPPGKGGNHHTGDIEKVANESPAEAESVAKEQAGAEGESETDAPAPTYLDFPSKPLVVGHMSYPNGTCGYQLIALLLANVVARVAFNGAEYFYLFDGVKLYALTAEERAITDLF